MKSDGGTGNRRASVLLLPVRCPTFKLGIKVSVVGQSLKPLSRLLT